MHELGPRSRVAIISDVHANVGAYRAALAAAERQGFDRLVILGDLLTYGADPLAVIDTTHEAVERHGAILIIGNHDQLYFDLSRGDLTYYAGLPVWIREVVDWTAEAVSGIDLQNTFDWRPRWTAGAVLFAHANPFPFGDWRYLTSESTVVEAADALVGQGRVIGVFGHTHRHNVTSLTQGSEGWTVAAGHTGSAGCELKLDERQVGIIDAGSVGQPRDNQKASTIVVLASTSSSVAVEFLRLHYDTNAHRQTLAAMSVSEGTRLKLLSYF